MSIDLLYIRVVFGVIFGVCVGRGMGELSRHSPGGAAILAVGWFGYLLMDLTFAVIEIRRQSRRGSTRGEQ